MRLLARIAVWLALKYAEPYVKFYRSPWWEKVLYLAFAAVVLGTAIALTYYDVKKPTDYVTEYFFPSLRKDKP